MHEKIRTLITKARERDEEWQENMRKNEEEHRVAEDRKQKELFPKLRKAEASDYIEWLKGYIGNGGEPSHFYDYPFSQPGSFYIATEDFRIFPLFGSAAIHIIVPKGIHADVSESTGHCCIYFMDGFRIEYCTSWVPVYQDTII